MKLREIAASFIQPEMEDIMTLQQKKSGPSGSSVISALSLCLFFLLWYLVTDVLKLAPATLFPSPVTALETGIAKWTTKKPDGATLPTHIFSSLRVSLLGFCFGACIGVPLGVVMAWWEPMDTTLRPVFDFIRNIPPIAWIPIMIILLGIGVVAKAAIVFLSPRSFPASSTLIPASNPSKRYISGSARPLAHPSSASCSRSRSRPRCRISSPA